MSITMGRPQVIQEYEWEPIRGLPGRLPPGETLLWQGAPSWRGLVCSAMHVRALGGYFAVLLTLRAAIHGFSSGLLLLALLAGAVLLMLTGFAWMIARTTVYSVTDKRIVFRYGVAVPKAVNIPFASVVSADAKLFADGSGDIPLALGAPAKVAYPLMWPHVRPWHLTRAQPMLRAVPDAVRAAQTLARAMAATGGEARSPSPAISAPMPAPGLSPQALA